MGQSFSAQMYCMAGQTSFFSAGSFFRFTFHLFSIFFLSSRVLANSAEKEAQGSFLSLPLSLSHTHTHARTLKQSSLKPNKRLCQTERLVERRRRTILNAINDKSHDDCSDVRICCCCCCSYGCCYYGLLGGSLFIDR